ncbi:diacylglycerol kinase family protein [Sphingopyxis sp.]|uniref:diacylglycerol kinase family protein n=1 Tax=Sphingopyxis sp. TaxID=1908224 RepID=UPI003D13D1AD
MALAFLPVVAWRPSPLAWRPHDPAAPRPAIWAARMRSFGYAVSGLSFAVRNESNMRIHAGASMCVVVLGLWIGLDPSEWRWLIVAMVVVIAAEALNTAVEQCCNAVSESFHPAIKSAKDVAAGAVLVSAFGAGLIGISVLAPHFLTARAIHFPTCGDAAIQAPGSSSRQSPAFAELADGPPTASSGRSIRFSSERSLVAIRARQSGPTETASYRERPSRRGLRLPLVRLVK